MEHNIKIFTNCNEDGSHRGREKKEERVRGGGEMGQNEVVKLESCYSPLGAF